MPDPVAVSSGCSDAADKESDEPPPGGSLDDTGEQGLSVGDEVRWDLALDPGSGHAVRLAGETDAAGIRLAARGQEITTYLTPYGNFSAIQRTCRLAVRQADWSATDGLVLRGDCTDIETVPPAILLRSTGSGYQHTVPLHWQDHAFTVALSPGSMPGQAGNLPLASGNWERLTRAPTGENRVVADRRLLTRLPAPRTAGIHEVTVETYRGDGLRLAVRLASAEKGPYAQRQLQKWYGSQAGSGRIDDLAVFDATAVRYFTTRGRVRGAAAPRHGAGLRVDHPRQRSSRCRRRPRRGARAASARSPRRHASS